MNVSSCFFFFTTFWFGSFWSKPRAEPMNPSAFQYVFASNLFRTSLSTSSFCEPQIILYSTMDHHEVLFEHDNADHSGRSPKVTKNWKKVNTISPLCSRSVHIPQSLLLPFNGDSSLFSLNRKRKTKKSYTKHIEYEHFRSHVRFYFVMFDYSSVCRPCFSLSDFP